MLVRQYQIGGIAYTLEKLEEKEIIDGKGYAFYRNAIRRDGGTTEVGRFSEIEILEGFLSVHHPDFIRTV